MPILKTLMLGASCAAALMAQQGAIDGPIAGYVFDAHGQSLRAIRGIPGAALVGDPVDFGVLVTAAWVAPKLDSALVLTADGAPHIYRLDGGKAVERPADGLVAPERAIFSPSGTALAVVTPGSVRVFRGLPDSPAATGTVALPTNRVAAAGGLSYGKMARPGGGPVAVSDDGQYLLYGNGNTIEILGIGGDSRKLADSAPGALPVFAPGGHDAAVIDAQTISFFNDIAGAATVRRISGVSGVRGAGFSPDGKRLFLAAATVTALDVATGERSEIACECHPSLLVRMGSTYRLNDLGSGPLWLLDASAEPKIVFVPAAR